MTDVNSDTTEYRHRDIVRDGHGCLLWRDSEQWRLIDGSSAVSVDTDRLTLLVRDGQVVTP